MKLYGNEEMWRKTAKLRRWLGYWALAGLVIMVVGFVLLVAQVRYAMPTIIAGAVVYVLHIPIREHTKKLVGWRGL